MIKHYGTIPEIRQRTIKEIEELQRQTQWRGDQKLNDILHDLKVTSDYEEDIVIMLAEEFQLYKPKYMTKIQKFAGGSND